MLLQIMEPGVEFTILFFGSFFIGAISALLIAFILKKGKRSRTIKINNEISMMILCPWVSYLIAEGLEFSGIVSILINGVFLAQYVTPNLSAMSRKVIKAGYETAAWGAESIVFLFIGIGVFAIDQPFEHIGALGILAAFILMNIARALNIGITSAVWNLTRKENKIQWKFQFLMWIAGLRGAMAYALALESMTDYSTGKIMLVVTLAYALFSVLFIGSILGPVLGLIGVEKSDQDLQTQIAEDESFYDKDENEKIANWGEKVKFLITKFNQKYFRPIFVVNSEEAELVLDEPETTPALEPNKRNSDSVLFELKLENQLEPKMKKVQVHSLEDEKDENHSTV